MIPGALATARIEVRPIVDFERPTGIGAAVEAVSAV